MKSVFLPLNFTTFYLCGIKPFTKISQRNCVNLLLKGVHPTSGDSYDVLSDSVCSNYANGKKPIKDELRLELVKLTEDDFKVRIDKVGIQEPLLVAKALHKLIEKSGLQNRTKDLLLKSFENEEPQTFIAKVFNHAIRAAEVRPLNREEEAVLASCIGEADENTEEESVPEHESFDMGQSSKMKNTFKNNVTEEEAEWLMDYLPATFANDSFSFLSSPVRVERICVNMPMDYRALVNTLKPTLTENTLSNFSFEEFIKAMDIDGRNGKVKSGSLLSWAMCGALESICDVIDGINFSQVSDFAIQIIGQFRLDEAKTIIDALKRASNQNVHILQTLIYVNDASDIELRIITHICPDKAREQKEDIRIYHTSHGK